MPMLRVSVILSRYHNRGISPWISLWPTTCCLWINRRRHFRHFRWRSSLKVLRPKWFLFFNNKRLLAITTDVLGSSKLEKIQNLVLNLLKQTVPRESTAPLNAYTSRISSTHSKVNHLLRHNKQYHISRKVPPNSYRLNGHRLKR